MDQAQLKQERELFTFFDWKSGICRPGAYPYPSRGNVPNGSTVHVYAQRSSVLPLIGTEECPLSAKRGLSVLD